MVLISKENRTLCRVALGALAWVVVLGFPTAQAPGVESDEGLMTHSRSLYTHRITLYDEDGIAICPEDILVSPFSTRMTCGKCHAYAQIGSGWHFNASDPNIDPGKPGEPWILTDRATGTQIPLSERSWPGTYRPESLGLTPWKFVQLFGHHTPGGGMGEPSSDTSQGDPEARWSISGNLEIECMMCHSVDATHDQAEWAEQIKRQNFKWASVATLGLGVVRGSADKVPDDYDPFLPPDPDFPERSGPVIQYNEEKFDADDRAFFNTTTKVPAERCFFCHTNRDVGPGAQEDWAEDLDVHLLSGLTCTDCHRHGLDHAISRGYDEEWKEKGSASVATLSCRGCHLGVESVTGGLDMPGGRLGAPRPVHKGIPTVHFDRLTCTVCHSGPFPQSRSVRVQTSRAHGLGLAEKDREDDVPPLITEPVFVREEDGRFAPHRMMWPAFWALT